MPLCPVDPTCRLYYEIVTTRLPLLPLGTPFPANTAFSESSNSAWTGKPKLLILVPLTFDISAPCMRELLSNDELLEKFDLVALEPRGHGRTECDPTPSQDAWTGAGDLIMFMDKLGLPAAHIMSGHNVSSDAVLRMATIAPEMVLSMTLCGIARQVDSAFFNYAINEIVIALGHSSSLEEWYEAIIGKFFFNFGYSNDQLLQDEYGGIFIRRYNPHQAVRVFVSMGYWVGRPKIPAKLLAQVRTRTTIIQGEEDVPYGPEAGHELEGLLCNAKDLKYVKIAGAPTCVAVTSMDEILTHILSIPTAPASSPSPACDVRAALHRLQNVASLTPGSECVKNIASRPLESGSFSIMPEAKIAEVAVELKRMVETEPIFEVPGMDDPEPWTGKTWDECHTHLWRNRYL